ncbi:UDP-glucuronosyl/UDP-glucosyltransferase [Macleaya cordata]|uniref:Glycosyltransferase n=1 Tax=Macleaya cordata TaxID=56857 RepID=A0A200QG04_MACCD|nr:UDP-glucuronosyl/UDP-glucosyltransferase [Macleaya cordata]
MEAAKMNSSRSRTFHAAMHPWLAMGHLTPFLHLSNKLAERGHRVSFFSPTKTISKLESLNLYPHLISFVPLVVPHVDGLPLGAETMSDVPPSMAPILAIAFHSLQNHVEALLLDLKPDFVFYDLAGWVPSFTRPLGIKSVYHIIFSAATVAYFLVPSREIQDDDIKTKMRLMSPPPGFPPSPLNLHLHELHAISFWARKNENTGLSLYDFLSTSMKQCDIICARTCREIEGPYCDYLESQYAKPVLLTGPALPDQEVIVTHPLEEKWANWLLGFKPGSVLYCAFGSERVLRKDEFQELVQGLELTGMPFLVALKPPSGAATTEEALPEGFEERIRGRGVVHGGWVQQPQILAHPSVGCFVSHCGFGSMWESLMNDCQIVLLPHLEDQCLNSRILTGGLKVAVEVERREEDGWFTRESVCSAVKAVMDEESQIAAELKANHCKLRELLSTDGLESSYMDNFIKKLQDVMIMSSD